MKMYIAVLDEFPDYMTPTLVAHAVLGHHTRSHSQLLEDHGIGNTYESLYSEWLHQSFKKVVLRVNQKEFDKFSDLPNATLSHENNTLNSRLACAVLVVDNNIPNVLKYAKLWKPKDVPCGH